MALNYILSHKNWWKIIHGRESSEAIHPFRIPNFPEQNLRSFAIITELKAWREFS
jgi:hypothetical protein